MIKPLLDFGRRHIILFGTAKFAAGLLIGFALGVYFLPILTEAKGLDTAALAQLEASAQRSGTFTRDLPGSDAFHWGEGTVRASGTRIWLEGKISPGPDYRLYRSARSRPSAISASMCRPSSRLAIIRRC